MRRFFLVLAAIAVGGTVAAPLRVSAQGFLDIYIGGAFTRDSSIDFETVLGDFSLPGDWDGSVAGGVRGGYWFQGWAKWIGLGADISYFQADPSSLVTFHLVPISTLAMVRLPLFTGDGFENGRLQPYTAIGPGFFLSVLTNAAVFGTGAGFDVGLDARAGVTVLLTSRFGLFIEYRYTDVDVETTGGFGSKATSSLQTNHVNGGVALRF